MRLFTTEEIKAIERYTMETEGISHAELIERMADGVADEICSRWRSDKPTIVFAGPGNNGADALASARILADRGFHPDVYLFNIGGDKLTAECASQRDRLLREHPELNVIEVTNAFNMPQLSSAYLVVDGLFGSGLYEELQGGFKMLVQNINDEGPTVVAIDLPSGMFGDWNPHIVNRNTIHATLTLAVQFPRLCFFIPDNAELVGEWKVIDIGLAVDPRLSSTASFCLVEQRDVRLRLQRRKNFCSKADFGSAILYAGAYGMAGAAVLASKGCLRAGVGKLTVCAPKCAYEILQTTVPEALYRHNRGELHIVDMHPDHSFTAIGAGPGIGTNELTVKALENFLATASQPLVLDADALNCIAIKPQMLNSIPVLSIITPHAGEFDRLFGSQQSSEARLRTAIEKARYYNIFIVLKGHYTAIVRPDGKVYFNASGTPAMATAGSGDVLTGIILAMLAQGYPPELASIIGVFVHGMAGELAEAEEGQYGVTAGDIAAFTGRAIKKIMS